MKDNTDYENKLKDAENLGCAFLFAICVIIVLYVINEIYY